MAEDSFFTKWERVIKSIAIQSWYCDQCQVEVRRVRCPHCGKKRHDEK